MTRYSRKKGNHGYSAKRKQLKMRKRTRDLDEIDVDMRPENAKQLLNQKIDVDVPGCAQYYCIHCARYFIDNHAMKEHFRSKVHKRRLKALETEPYTQKEAEAAAGIGNYTAPKKRKVETQELKE
ncbi:zinc finger protein 593-like [Uloborus diversus]|uniref:zinc finger protein 593-like n=1 Tax=Uloborus diversus TaxID=327109 RepID=UPI0024090BB9|nr:zinc finger protein 593-like [Uloborus diversus]